MIPRICSDKRLIIMFSLIALLTGPFILAEIPGARPDANSAGKIVMTADKGCYTGTDPGHGVSPLQMVGGRGESLTGSTVAFYPGRRRRSLLVSLNIPYILLHHGLLFP